MLSLKEFFKFPQYEKAFERYATFAQKSNWAITYKLDLYNSGKIAFDSNRPDEEKFEAFSDIYSNLRSYWQVFRNARAGYWTVDETYQALHRNCVACSRQKGLDLFKLQPNSKESKDVLDCLIRLKGIKPAAQYPYMPVAKFTHFYNPKLFPIFDNEILWKKVLTGAFKEDYKYWCHRKGFQAYEQTVRFNLQYMLYAADNLRSADAGFMDFFSQWFKREVEGNQDENHILDEIHLYQATAFEFIAIGASCLVQPEYFE